MYMLDVMLEPEQIVVEEEDRLFALLDRKNKMSREYRKHIDVMDYIMAEDITNKSPKEIIEVIAEMTALAGYDLEIRAQHLSSFISAEQARKVLAWWTNPVWVSRRIRDKNQPSICYMLLEYYTDFGWYVK